MHFNKERATFAASVFCALTISVTAMPSWASTPTTPAPTATNTPAAPATTTAAPATSTTPVSSASATQVARAEQAQICRTQTNLGSRLGKRKVCRSAAEWELIRRQAQEAVDFRQRNNSAGRSKGDGG